MAKPFKNLLMPLLRWVVIYRKLLISIICNTTNVINSVVTDRDLEFLDILGSLLEGKLDRLEFLRGSEKVLSRDGKHLQTREGFARVFKGGLLQDRVLAEHTVLRQGVELVVLAILLYVEFEVTT